jgi:S-adenosylmethionine hydrolase
MRVDEKHAYLVRMADVLQEYAQQASFSGRDVFAVR